MVIPCSAVVSKTNMIGDLLGYPGEVWYNLSGIANILSLLNVKKFYRVTFESSHSRCFRLHKDDGAIRKFMESLISLHYLDTTQFHPNMAPTGDPIATPTSADAINSPTSRPTSDPNEVSLLTLGSITTVPGQQAKYPQCLRGQALWA